MTVKFPCPNGCTCGGCIGECYMNDGCPDGAPCRPCYDSLASPGEIEPAEPQVLNAG